MEELTILTWFWQQPNGRSAYTSEHVNIWADMVRRHLKLPHRLACVTDTPSEIASHIDIINPPHEFEDWMIPTWPEEKPQCLRRIAMFRPDAADTFGSRFVCMDMDCVISDSIDSLFTRKEEIVLYSSPPGSVPTPESRPYNGSMLLLKAGSRPEIYNKFTLDGAVKAGQRFAGSDQAWISHILGPGEATWDEKDGVMWWGRWLSKAEGRIIFFPGNPKPWHLIERGFSDAVAEHYHRNKGRRCLVLGYAPSVWDDAGAALASGEFDAVIAAPETAAHWPGEVLAIARTDHHADRLVTMYGFEEVVFCGRTVQQVEAA